MIKCYKDVNLMTQESQSESSTGIAKNSIFRIFSVTSYDGKHVSARKTNFLKQDEIRPNESFGKTHRDKKLKRGVGVSHLRYQKLNLKRD